MGEVVGSDGVAGAFHNFNMEGGSGQNPKGPSFSNVDIFCRNRIVKGRSSLDCSVLRPVKEGGP